ncbi:MAG: gas vesicle protein GvpO [Bacillota bacterium]
MEKIIAKVTEFFKNNYQQEGRVIGIINEGDLWRAKVQIIEEDEYMARRARKDLLGIYEVMIDQNLEIIAYERVELKERGMI